MERCPRLLLATSAWRSVSPWRRIRYTIRAAVNQPSALLKHRFDLTDFSTQFFIIRNDPAVLRCILDIPGDEQRSAERQFFDAYLGRFNLDTVLRMRKREPVHPHNRQMCEADRKKRSAAEVSADMPRRVHSATPERDFVRLLQPRRKQRLTANVARAAHFTADRRHDPPRPQRSRQRRSETIARPDAIAHQPTRGRNGLRSSVDTHSFQG